jgi:hypothetical protein
MEIISRKEARAAGPGRRYYFTGKPCNRGLVARRLVSDKRCQCEAHRAYRNTRAKQVARDKAEEKRRREHPGHSAAMNRSKHNRIQPEVCV